MSLVETVHTVPSTSPVRDKMNDYSAYSPFGLVPSPTDFLNWDAGSPFFHQSEIKAEPLCSIEASSPHSLSSPSPSPPIPPHSPVAMIAENELLEIGGLGEFKDGAFSKVKSSSSRPHPYARPEQSILHSVLSGRNSQSRPRYLVQSAGFDAEISFLQNQASVNEAELRLEANCIDLMSELDRLVWSTVEADWQQVSQQLNIPRNPYEWSRTDVIKWLNHVQEELKLNCLTLQRLVNMTGRELLALSEQDFRSLLPQDGPNLYAKLDIFRSAWEKQLAETAEQPPTDAEDITYNVNVPDERFGFESPDIYLPLPVASPEMSNSYLSPYSDATVHSPNTIGSTPTPSPSYHSDVKDDDDGDEDSSQGGSHIHLWQFIKELLLQPELYGSSIRWVKREEGIFKIEDSVKVARLWGKRKNRPAMNYDKLSRSLRQYYKKGVMKKTERSQRLVYQFCDPYFK